MPTFIYDFIFQYENAIINLLKESGDFVEILFVRHGKTSWNKEKKMQGNVDIPLSEDGIAHAEMMAEKLKDKKIDVAFCSPLGRAKQTFEIINNKREEKIPILYEDALIERNYALYEGRNKKTFNYDIVWDYSNPLNVENFFEFAWPIVDFIFGKLLRAYKDKTVLIVSHGGVSKIFEMLLSKNSLYPEEVASYLPKNSEVITYTSSKENDFLFNLNEEKKELTEKDFFFQIITPNVVSSYFPKLKINDLIDSNKISKKPKIRYRASIVFARDDGKYALESYQNTKEVKLPARSIEPTRNILHQVREILLQMTGYLGNISDFYHIGETVEIRPSDPIAEVVFTEVYYLSKGVLVAEPLPDKKDEEEGFKLEFHSLEDVIKLMDKSLQEAKSLENEFYRPLITKKSIVLRDKLILDYWKAHDKSTK